MTSSAEGSYLLRSSLATRSGSSYLLLRAARATE